MKVDDELVDRLAKLSKLEFTDESREKIKSDMGKMLDFVDKLRELDTENVEPLIFMTDEFHEMRNDQQGEPLDKKIALKNAPGHDSDFFKVPKVVSDQGDF